MRESTRAVLMLVIVVLVCVLTYFFFFRPFMREQPKVRDVINENSTWSVTEQKYEMHGPLAAETYRLTNDNGKTTYFYAATNRAGTVTKEFETPLMGPEGTFLFEELRADGIWELDDRPVRPNPRDEYIIEIDQTLGDEGGTHSFSFSDPAFWAATHAREFQLKLPSKGSISAANMTSYGVAGRDLQEPRYLQIVKAMEAFGPPTILATEAKIRQQLADTAKHPIPPR